MQPTSYPLRRAVATALVLCLPACGSRTGLVINVPSDAATAPEVGADVGADRVDAHDAATDQGLADRADVVDVAGACDAGIFCDGVCVDPGTSNEYCGACGHACAATMSCVAGQCVSPSARPIAPLSTSTVTSQRPTLTWRLTAGTTMARVEVCRDRACTVVEETQDVSDESTRPRAALRRGVHFWRVRGVVPGVSETPVSATWQFYVGARDAAVDSSWGTTLDVNGDGYADVAVSRFSFPGFAHAVAVHLGGPAGIAATPAFVIDGATGPVASIGDVNGDGYGDLLVRASAGGPSEVFLGGAAALASRPAVTLSGDPEGADDFGAAVSAAGDLDGDGYGDVVVSAPSSEASAGRVYVFTGSPTGLSGSPTRTLSSVRAGTTEFGRTVVGAIDVNGDRYPDLLVGARSNASIRGGRGTIDVYAGGPSGLAAGPTTRIESPAFDDSYFGLGCANAGDVNGDGFIDVVVGQPLGLSEVGQAMIYLGSATGLATDPAATLTAPDGPNAQFGANVSSAGDFDGDGYADIAVGAVDAAAGLGRVYLYRGSEGGIGDAPSLVLDDPSTAYGARFASALASAGDVDGDGLGDLAVAGSDPRSMLDGYVFLGRSAATPPVPLPLRGTASAFRSDAIAWQLPRPTSAARSPTPRRAPFTAARRTATLRRT